jgi:hypothetical protein
MCRTPDGNNLFQGAIGNLNARASHFQISRVRVWFEQVVLYVDAGWYFFEIAAWKALRFR